MTRLIAAFGLVALSACSTPVKLPRGEAVFKPSGLVSPSNGQYRIGKGDVLSVNVFQEPDLSPQNLLVDSGGYITVPLIGQVFAVSRTGPELASEITRQLSTRFLVSPQVTVNVNQPQAPKVVVEGTVVNPGVYDIRGETTLLEALALADGPTRVANLKQVVVFRIVNGQRMGAVFDVSAIRRGEAVNPLVEANDTIVLGYSNVKAAWRDFLQAAPLIGVFTRF